ncbi:MAG: phosphomannomutase/phosphoglucomutase [Bdellovibrionota bacterium]
MSAFREYDIRGIADQDLTNDFVWALGRTLGELTKKSGDSRVYVGQDVRLSSPRLSHALSDGLRAGGVEVRVLSPGPTPLLYFVAYKSEKDFQTHTGIMITGSHNPSEYNGFKMVIAGDTLHGDSILALRDSVLKYQKEFPGLSATPPKTVDLYSRYVEEIAPTITLGRKLKVVLDGGNGAGGPLGLQFYKKLGCEVIPLFCEPDGRFPNHHPDPTVPKNLVDLQAKVLAEKADLGIAFDGDADRIGAVSATGQILFGDHLVLYFARDILKDIPGATIISEVKSSQILYDTLAKWGAKPIIWKTGHSLIKAKLKETGAALAGEMSGHMFFAHRFFGFDDALYAGARLMEGLSNRKESLDEFLASLPPAINTPEIRVDCPDDKKFGIVDKFIAQSKATYGKDVLDIDGARVKMHGGWGLLRASNTQPVLVLRFEAPDRSKLKQIRDDFAQILQKIDASVQVPSV